MNTVPAWVPVAEEINHRELFRNGLVRAYSADLRPGQRTAFHRHDEDTLYIVVAGGWSSRETLQGSVPYRFGRSVSLRSKLRMAAESILRHRVHLDDGTVLFMANRSRPTIHAVKAAEDNPSSMRLIGIELLSPTTEPSPRCREALGEAMKTAELVVKETAIHRFRNGEESRKVFDPRAKGILLVVTEGQEAGHVSYLDPGRGAPFCRDVRRAGIGVVLY